MNIIFFPRHIKSAIFPLHTSVNRTLRRAGVGVVGVLPAPGLQAAWLSCRCRARRQNPWPHLCNHMGSSGSSLCLQMTLVISRCNPHMAATCSGPSNDVSLPLAGPVCIHRGSKRPAFPGPYTRTPERSPSEAGPCMSRWRHPARTPGQLALPPP